MATLKPVTNLPYQLMDANGDPAVGGTLEFYLEGTTDTTELFTSDGTSIGTSITLNAMGMPESGGNVIVLFRDQSKAIKIVGKTATGVTIYTSDSIPAEASFDATASAKLDGIDEDADKTDATSVAAAGAVMVDGSADMTGSLGFSNNTYIKNSTVSGIVASTTQTQAAATAITSMVSEVAEVANAGDAVRLPTGVVGVEVKIIHNGAESMGVFPPVGGKVNGGATDAVYTHVAGSNLSYVTYDGTAWEVMVPASESTTNTYGTMYDTANTDAYVVNETVSKHCYHTNGMAAANEVGVTFDAGGAGTSFPIASIADGAAAGVDIEVTTTGSHGLAVGDIVSQTNLTSAVYTGVFKVKAIISATQYEVAAVYTATDTGTMDQAATMSLDTAGNYKAQWWASATSASSSETFDYFLYLDAVPIVGAATRRKYGTGGDWGSFSGGTPIFSATAGQKLSWVLTNNDSAGNLTVRNLTVMVEDA